MKFETKFDVGDRCWFVGSDAIRSGTVLEIVYRIGHIYYGMSDELWELREESRCFKTLQEAFDYSEK